MKALVVENLHKTYGHFEALKGIDFSIEPGKCFGLLGTNGAGKSTTIKAITGQIAPTSGSIQVFGLSPQTNTKEVHNLIGLVPESLSIYEDLSVKQNIDVFKNIFELPHCATQKIIERLGLKDKTNTKVKDLSKGLKQRVLIARAIIHSPKLLLLDEPTSGLDPSSAETIYTILEELKEQGTTILLTTHLMNDVERLCDDLIFIHKGELVARGTPQELKEKYQTQEITVKAIQREDRQESILKYSLEQDFLKALSELKLTHDIVSIHTHEPKLEEIFIQVTGIEQ